jgi:endoglucanase
MKKLKSNIIALAILISAAAFLNATPVSVNGRLHVNGLQLTNSCGNPVQLRGVDTHGLQWHYACYTAAAMDFIAYTMNADVIRIAVYVYQNGYLNDPPDTINEINTIADMATARGMYVIIDWHVLSDGTNDGDGDPNTNITDAETFWTTMATRYASYNNVFYEICNEPSGNSTDGTPVTWAKITTYANTIIPLIRGIDPNAVIIVGTPNWSQLGAAVYQNQLSYPNIMYTFHFYAGTHTISMLTPYITAGQYPLPIFVTEWSASSSSGTSPDNYTNATNFLNVLNASNNYTNTTGEKISWSSWSFADDGNSSSMLNQYTCSGGVYSTSVLSTAGNYVMTNINNPQTINYCGTQTFTASPTPFAGSPTCTPTITVTPTQIPWDLIYDGDTAGDRLSDGVAVSNAWVNANATPIGTITETTGGNPGNGMKLSFASAAYWEGHSWTKTVTVGQNNNIAFDFKAVAGTVSQLLFTLDRGAPANRIALNATNSWQTITIPLSSLYPSLPATISEFDFVDNSASDYTVMVDNIRLICVPSATVTSTATLSPTITQTPTITNTFTITQTFTISPTSTITPTITMTPTYVARFVAITDFNTYPNPTMGDRVTFRFTIAGYADKVFINVYTFGDRKIASMEMDSVAAGVNTYQWQPRERLANGLYYYSLTGTNGNSMQAKHVGAFFVNKNIFIP